MQIIALVMNLITPGRAYPTFWYAPRGKHSAALDVHYHSQQDDGRLFKRQPHISMLGLDVCILLILRMVSLHPL